MYIVKFLNDESDWIRKSFHSNLCNAESIAEVTAKAGYVARIEHEGKIIRYYDKESSDG
jgi:hypothetical protein